MFDVRFVSPNTGENVAEFTRQTRHEVQLLRTNPPDSARLCNAEMRIRSCSP